MIELITNIIGGIFYPLFMIIFVILDVLQDVFRGFAGIEDIRYGRANSSSNTITSGNSGEANDTGILFYLLRSQLVINMIWSIAILAVFLLIIFTAMTAIKNIYTSKPKKWQEIIGKALIGLANFVVVPIVCLFGVWLGNIVLKAVDGATSPASGSVKLSRKLFYVAAYNANAYRADKLAPEDVGDTSIARLVVGKYQELGKTAPTVSEGMTNAELADIVDECYGDGGLSIYDVVEGSPLSTAYNFYRVNYLTLVAGGIFMLWVLVNLSYGMVKRLFTLLVLYMISPVVCAMYPWDDGKALGSWRSSFVKNVTSVFGAVAGMNLFFSVLPLVENIRLNGSFVGLTNAIVKLLIIISGLFAVKDFISLISNLIGSEDAFAQGSALRGAVTGGIKKQMGNLSKKTATAAGAFTKAKIASKSGGVKAGIKSLRESMRDSAVNGLKEGVGLDIKGVKDSVKAVKDEAAKKAQEAADKQADKASKGQSAYGAKNSAKAADDAFTSADKKATAVQNSIQNSMAATRLGISSGSFNDDGTIQNLTVKSDTEIEMLRIKASAPGATDVDKNAYEDALFAREVANNWREASEKKAEAAKTVRSAALSFADQLTALADSYDGADKAALQQEAQKVRTVANDAAKSVADITAAVNAVGTNILGSGCPHAREIESIISTGA